MIIKNLWMINQSGLCVYSYRAKFSDYDLDVIMFGGFIRALASFTETLSQKNIRFLKLEEDELYFRNLKDIIVVSIMNTAGAEQTVIDQMLEFIGEKFLDSYLANLKSPTFDWSTIVEPFTEDISYVIGDEELYEEMKRELINNLLQDIMQGKQPPDVLTWKIAYLFSSSTHDEINKTLEMIDQVQSIIPSMKYDAILESKINDAFFKAKVQLSTKLIKDRNQLLVLCANMDLYNKIFKNFLAFGTLCIQHRDFSNLFKTLSSMKNSKINISFNVLIIDPIPSEREFNQLNELNLDNNLYIWENRTVNKNIEQIISKNSKLHLANPICNLDYGCPKVFDMVIKINADSDEFIEELKVDK